MRTAAIVLGLTLLASSASAQVQCVPMSELRPDAVITPVMPDEDGDLWVSVRFRSTGRMLLGFLSHEKGGLCIVREGHTTPES
jgi:hypothetical protein